MSSGRHREQKRPSRGWRRVRRFFLISAVSGAVLYSTLNGTTEVMTNIFYVVVIAGLGLLIWLITRGSEMSLAQRAGLVLDGLSDAGFVVLHDLRIDRRRLEFVVVGPPGVSVVRSEPGSNAIIDSGIINKEAPDRVAETLKELREDVACLRSHIKPLVAPLLVTSRELDLEVPNNGELVSVGRLEEFLRGQSHQLDERTIRETVIDVLRAATAATIVPSDITEEGVNSA